MQKGEYFRAHFRGAVSLVAKLSLPDEGLCLATRVADLGIGGACVCVDQSVPVGTSVQLSITAPHLWDALVIDGKVAWVQTDGSGSGVRAGICFEHGSGPTLRALVELLASNLYG